MKVLIIIPAHNEEESLERVVDELTATCPQYDYVVVNDGSTDLTGEICERRHYNVINLSTNLGLAGAVHTGMKYARKKQYDMAIQFDADGQHLPEYIEPMVHCMVENKSDIVIGSRYIGERMPVRMRTLGARVLRAVIYLATGEHIADPTSGMRLYSRRMIECFAADASLAPEPDTLVYLIRQGAKVKEIKVRMEDRYSGQSYLTPVNAIKYMIHETMSILVFQRFRKMLDLKYGQGGTSSTVK